MEPSIENREAFTVLGIQTRINPSKADYTAIWQDQFMKHHDAIKALAVDDGYYGVYFGTDEPEMVDMIAGMRVADTCQAPEGLVVRQIPAAQYAMFECSLDKIGDTWHQIYEKWLPQSDYEEAPEGGCFEYYPPDVHSGKTLSIYVRIRAK